MVKTPEQKWKESINNYKKKCQKILKVSNSIRYVGVINEYGRTLTGIIRPGEKPLLKSDQAKSEFFIISTLQTFRKKSSYSLGKLDYLLLKHQKVSVLVFQKNNITFYVSIESNEKNLSNIVTKIKKII
ncbi:MAG: hypothetical protein NPMRTHETA2_680008 [Nitrosopumilales archaeon]|nr:MAG: hypothetical protein NPMRTHETA2_680008 [Nitrosopumilales archaeon]